MRFTFPGFILLCALSLLLTGCRLLEKPRAITVNWNGDKAESIEIPKRNLEGHPGELHVRLLMPGKNSVVGVPASGSPTTGIDILGTIKEAKAEFIFTPAVPLTLGMNYQVLAGDFVLGEVAIPESTADRPYLLNIYPSIDTLPENLLKIHLRFSKPMAEGRSMNYLTLMKDKDTLKGTFLDLQPELWNGDGTDLTVWLDPGRIKLDLIPNKEFGNPLTKGTTYKLFISPEWKSKDGKALTSNYDKTFYVTSRDDRSPDIERWQLRLPSPGSYDELVITFDEILDQTLIQSTITLVDSDNKPVHGKFQMADQEKMTEFIPDEQWKKGQYTLQVEGRLEDLAGNNLNRLFERDLIKDGEQGKEKRVFKRIIVIQ